MIIVVLKSDSVSTFSLHVLVVSKVVHVSVLLMRRGVLDPCQLTILVEQVDLSVTRVGEGVLSFHDLAIVDKVNLTV